MIAPLLLVLLGWPSVVGRPAVWTSFTAAEEAKAAMALEPLVASFETGKGDREALRRELVAFRCVHAGTPSAYRAALLLTKLPSPLDALDPSKMDAGDRKDFPKEVVALLHGHTRPVAALAFAPDGATLASAGWDNKLRLWKLGGPAAISWSVLSGGPSGLAFAPDGKTLASGGGDTQVQLWDVSGKEPRERDQLAGHSYRPFALAFTPNGKLLVTGSFDPVLRFWDLRGKEPDGWSLLTNDTSAAYYVASVAISPDGKLLATGSALGGRLVRVWRLEGALLDELELPKVQSHLVAFSPDGAVLLTAGEKGPTVLWEMDQAKFRQRLKLKTAGAVHAAAFAVDGKTLATAGEDGKLTLWDVGNGQQLKEWTLPVAVKAVLFAPDNRHLLAGGSDGTILVIRLHAHSG